MNDVLLAFIALLPFIGAVLAFWSSKWHHQSPTVVALATASVSLLGVLSVADVAWSGDVLLQTWSWIPQLGLWFSFRLDGLSLMFALLILIMGILVIIYARYYLSAKDSLGRFFAYLLAFMGSMLGIVLSENIIQLVVFWELTSLSSFLLITYWQHRKEARNGARMALAITGAGGLALLAGVLMLGHIVGSYQLSDVLIAGDLIRQHDWYELMLALILLGAFTKSAQFPFHFWLPHAMAAPTPVSAYLHSATMVKAGIFLLIRLYPALSGTDMWFWLVAGTGAITFVVGAYFALFKHDLKGLLAYSTISHLGLIMLLLGLNTDLALVAAVFHILNHATFKASLFMVAGIVDHEAGGRDMRRLGGLYRFMPHTAILAMIAAAAMAGVPLLNGFLSKEMFFEQVWILGQVSLSALFVLLLVIFASIFAVAYSLRFIHDVFFGDVHEMHREPQEPCRAMRLPVFLLVAVCLAVGIFPTYTVAPILNVAISATLLGVLPSYSISLWHGVNFPLLMSLMAIVFGVLLYINRYRFMSWHEQHLTPIDFRTFYELALEKLYITSRQLTQFFDRGSLQNAVAWVITTSLVAGVFGFMWQDTPLLGERGMSPVDPISILVAFVMIVSTVLAGVLHRERYIAIVTMGVVGLIVALGFVYFSAPDLALTQIAIEMVTVILLLLALYFLPQKTPKEVARPRLIRDLTLAILVGTGVAILAFAVMTREFSSVSGFFIDNSLLGGGGTNVVNVILVDFRGFDTLGEVVVLALAGLGIYAMLDQMRLPAPAVDISGRLWDKDLYPVILQTFSRILFPLMLLIAVFIFLRGHNLPGGGFIAGLVASVALVVQYIANGIQWTADRVRLDMHWAIGMGLLLATFTGLFSMLLGYPFLTSAFTLLDWPLVGEFEVASAIAFDLGVFMAVVGAMVMTLVQLGKLSDLSHEHQQEAK